MCPACYKNNTRKRSADGGHYAGARSVERASSGRGDPARDKHGHAAKRQRVRDIDRPPHERTVHIFFVSENGWILMLYHTKKSIWQLPGGESESSDDTIFETAARETAEELGTCSRNKEYILQTLKHLKDSRRAKMQIVSDGMQFVNIAVIVPCKTLTEFMRYFRLPGQNASMQDRMYNTKLSKEHSGYCFVRLEHMQPGKRDVKVDGAYDENWNACSIPMQCKHMYSADTLDALQRMHEEEISWASLPGRG